MELSPANQTGIAIGGGAVAAVATLAMIGRLRRPAPEPAAGLSRAASSGWSFMASVLGSIGGAYHSLLTNGDSLGWGCFWFCLGGLIPPVGIVAGAYGVYRTYNEQKLPAGTPATA